MKETRLTDEEALLKKNAMIEACKILAACSQKLGGKSIELAANIHLTLLIDISVYTIQVISDNLNKISPNIINPNKLLDDFLIQIANEFIERQGEDD